ncbi:helix-turn-helix domain-containing protein [Sphingobacterium hungaricum]|uniref:AraC family transcriptional regulator n=1 Tax=Sphingobacterium hungaricum TaxID=2082723 RepID=A0A928YTA5_9SPHI|nr:AraC family transcriptional regulator [Sphingobacterium hungaricum]MBE8714988.1 AraC family transcriptional regulator [Sphingobacterium hungaricum]
MEEKVKTNRRADEISKMYFAFLDQHIQDVSSGKLDDFMELNQIASELFISHQHLSDTIQRETGHHPCYFYDSKIIEQAQKLLLENELSVAAVARTLTYDPSNFSKFFKKMVGQTPKAWVLKHKN